MFKTVNFVHALWLLALVLVAPHGLAAGDACQRGFEQLAKPTENLRRFFEAKSPVRLGSAADAPYFTFSFDSEIPYSDVFSTIYSDPAALEELNQGLHGIVAYSDQTPITLDKIPADFVRKVLKVSDKQLKAFQLKPNIPLKEFYSLSELRAPAAGNFIVGAGESNYVGHKISGLCVSAVQKVLDKNNLPIEVGTDLGYLELRHKSSEAIPQSYYALVKDKLHKMFKAPQTHLHIALPESEISLPQAATIARAIESRIIFSILEDWTPGTSALAYTHGSSLFPKALTQGSARNVVRLGKSEFTQPFRAHDLEIRQWYTIDEGLDNLAFAARLGEQRSHLLVMEDFAPVEVISIVPDSEEKHFPAIQTRTPFSKSFRRLLPGALEKYFIFA